MRYGCARAPSGRCCDLASCRPPQIRRLRDVSRYRTDLVEARAAEKQRVEKLLEDAQIKLSVVASDIFGVSGHEMMNALIGGQRDLKVLAAMARGRMRAKRAQLEEAFTGYLLIITDCC
jgi:transposase